MSKEKTCLSTKVFLFGQVSNEQSGENEEIYVKVLESQMRLSCAKGDRVQ